jgi:hypothetical protein
LESARDWGSDVFGTAIGTAERIYGVLPGKQPAESAAVVCWVHRHITPDFTLGLDGVSVVLAYVNHGRWMVKCPDCRTPQIACESDRRFFCTACLNHSAKGKWRKVLWPKELIRRQIESILLLRPVPNQNWEPPETIEDLRRENVEHELCPG